MPPSKSCIAFLANLFLRRRLLKIFLYIFLCKNSTPTVTQNYPQRSWFKQPQIYTFSYKFSLFWSIGFWKDFGKLQTNLMLFVHFAIGFGWNWPTVSDEKVENEKSLQTKGRTDKQTNFVQKSTLELSAHVSLKSH